MKFDSNRRMHGTVVIVEADGTVLQKKYHHGVLHVDENGVVHAQLDGVGTSLDSGSERNEEEVNGSELQDSAVAGGEAQAEDDDASEGSGEPLNKRQKPNGP